MAMSRDPIKMLLLFILLFLSSLTHVSAQEPDEAVETASDGVIAPSGQFSLTLRQLGYDIRTFSQNNNSRIYRIDLPGNFEILPTGNYVNLITSHAPEVPDKPAYLSVEVNNRVLSTTELTPTNAVSNTTRVDLPEGLLRAGSNSMRVRLNIAVSCEDPPSVLNLSLSEDSFISFNYQQKPYVTDLALYPFPFTERSLLRTPVTIVLPDQPTSTDLSAAATVAAGLGVMSGNSIDISAVLASDITPDIRTNHHLIVIGQPDKNILLQDALELPLPIDSTTIQPGQGILQEIISPWNEYRLMLIVSGLDSEGVLKAGYALNRQANFLGMRGPIAIIVELLPLAKPDQLSAVSTTLAALGYSDEVAYGASGQEYDFGFSLPIGWQLEELPFFVLKFSHSDILDPAQSIIDVKLNNRPIGSTLLEKSNANNGELPLSLPQHLLKTGWNQLRVGVAMSLPSNNPCQDRNDERAWTMINSQSEIFLPYSSIDLPPNLNLLPYPFSQNGSFDQSLIVLPDQPDQTIYNDLIKLAAKMAGSSKPEYISVQTAYASEVDKAMRAKYHLILLGRPTENGLLQEVNGYLPQPFVPETDLLEPLAVDTIAFLPDPTRDAGLIQIATSPWNENYNILAVTGTTDNGFSLGLQALLNQTGNLKGNLAVVEPSFDPAGQGSGHIQTYAIDTRPPTLPEQEANITGAPASENDLSLLAKRWWK